jgi:prevent-host-death family protein
MSRAIDATEVGNHISELIQQVVEQQQPLIIESEGKPQVVCFPSLNTSVCSQLTQ